MTSPNGSSTAQLSMDKSELLHLYRQMMQIRRFEEHAAEQYAHAKIAGFLHLYIGEEGIAVGSISAKQPQDHVVTHYRDHGYALALGIDPNALMAELFGRSTGISGGRGGSMHMADPARNFWGGYAIVGGHIPIATGLGLASQYQEQDAVAMCYFGDGATNTGAFHESLNFAGVWKLPVLYICENNLYGMGTAVEYVSAVPSMAKKATAYDIPAVTIDGQDVMGVRSAVQAGLEHCRSGKGPYFIEAMTYRFRGHSLADPEVYRTKEEVEAHRHDDPITRFRDKLVADGVTNDAELDQIDAEVADEMEAAVQYADESPAPDPSTLTDYIYAGS